MFYTIYKTPGKNKNKKKGRYAIRTESTFYDEPLKSLALQSFESIYYYQNCWRGTLNAYQDTFV